MRRSEHGFTLVFMAMSMVAMLIASAFAIDLGAAYTSRRQMQNSADAAAMAGTRALFRSRNTLTGAFADITNAVWTTTRATAVANGADAAQVTCNVIRRDQSTIAPCSPSTGWVLDAILGGAAGVAVTAAVTDTTAFAKVVNRSTLTARASAAALAKPLLSSNGAPFLVCGVGDSTLKKSSWPADPLDPDLVSLPINLLLPSGAVNPLAVGHVYGVQGSSATIATCGANSAFDGKTADGDADISLPSWQTGTNGNGNDSGVYDTVAGATPCIPPNFGDCDLVLPVADAGSGYQLHVVALAVFRVTGNGNGNPKYAGRLLSINATVTRGQGGPGNCAVGQACVIKLVS
jgi:Flp pilus assembly protein TadG